jgi:1-deoxy-D-xylulose-5-phosphate synthase
LALQLDGPSAIRYPKSTAATVDGKRAPVEFGKSEVLTSGEDGTIISGGALLFECIEAANRLRDEGLSVGVINARFVKPLDTDTIVRAIRETGFVVTVEEATLMGGFGSAVLEAASEAGVNTSRVRRLGIGDHYVEHGERSELLADLGLDAAGIAAACRSLATSTNLPSDQPWPATQQPVR